jgi:hypothetical protein
MRRRTFIFGLASLAAATPAAAETLADRIVAELRRQGYSRISVSRTLLGRVRIAAVSRRHSREIIVNPRTGEILRDYWVDSDGSGATILDPDSSGGDGSKGIGQHDDDDDGESDDDDHDGAGEDDDGSSDDEEEDDHGGSDDGDDDHGGSDDGDDDHGGGSEDDDSDD